MRRLVAVAAITLVAGAPVRAEGPRPCEIDAFTCGAGSVETTESHFEGAIVVPGSQAANREVARSGGCEGCEWTLVRRCDLNTPADPGQANCLGARCDDGGVAYRLYLRRPEDVAPVLLDTICVSESRRIVTAAELAVDVERHVTRLVPPRHTIRVERPGYAVVRVPVFLSAAGPATESTTLDVDTPAGRARLRIEVGARRYAWTFGDGGGCETGSAGGPWDGDRTGEERCDTRVAHGYAAPGDAAVTLAVTWAGMYTFDVGYGAVGPLAVPGEGVRAPEVRAVVPVREARAVLVGG